MGCFPVQPINPLNQALLSILGENYYPTYAAQFQPADRSKMTNDKFLQYQTPGGGKIKPVADGTHKHISQILTSVTGLLGSVFNFFAPLFIVLDLIRALVDIICAFFNPIPVVLTVVELFITVIPPIIALYPPLSSILHAINAAKLVIAIVGSLGSVVIAVIDKIVECGLALVEAGANGDVAALAAIPLKLCALIQEFANELGGLTPISFILEILDFFLGLGAKLFCPTDASCCNEEFCPPIIVDPPSGTGEITFSLTGITIGDLVAPLRNVDFDTFFGLPITILDPPIVIPLNDLSLGLFEDLTIGPFQIGPFGPIDLLPLPDAIADFVLVPPLMTLVFNDPPDNIADLQNFIIHPNNLSSPDDGTVPATLRMSLRRTDVPNFPPVVGALTFYGPPQFEVSLGGLSIQSPDFGLIPPFVNLYLDAFPAGTPVEWTLEPDIIELLKNNLIGLGCEDSIRQAADGVAALINESVPSAEALGNPVDNGFSPLGDKIGRQFPPLPIDELNECLAAQEADPTVSQAQCVFDIVTDYIDEVSEFTEDVVCIGSSPTGSVYEINRRSVTADGKDFAIVTLQVNDIAGNQLLNGTVSDNFSAQFSTTLGTLGPVTFDRENSTFQVAITAEETGRAEISAAFLVRDVVCMRPGKFDGFSITEKILTTDFIRPGGNFPRQRRKDQYVQSRGRRR